MQAVLDAPVAADEFQQGHGPAGDVVAHGALPAPGVRCAPPAPGSGCSGRDTALRFATRSQRRTASTVQVRRLVVSLCHHVLREDHGSYREIVMSTTVRHWL